MKTLMVVLGAVLVFSTAHAQGSSDSSSGSSSSSDQGSISGSDTTSSGSSSGSAQGAYTGSTDRRSARRDRISTDDRSLQTMARDQRYDMELNGGIGGYFGSVGDATVRAGPAYGVTGAYNASRNVGVELGYLGHSNSIDGSSARLSSNQIQADIKLGRELKLPVAWRPYVFGGLGADFVHAGAIRGGNTGGVSGITGPGRSGGGNTGGVGGITGPGTSGGGNTGGSTGGVAGITGPGGGSGASASGFNSVTQGVIPLGVGADFFTRSPIRVGARATYDLTGIGGAVSRVARHPDGWSTNLTAAAAF